MKKAAVLGATGGMGSVLVEELTGRGIETVAFARSAEGLRNVQARTGSTLMRMFPGDAGRPESIRAAIQGCDTVFHSINLPYPEWEKELLPLTGRILDAVKAEGARLVVIDNIYSYGRASGVPVGEDEPKRPHTRKGNLRLRMDEMLMSAAGEGVPVLIAHFPDFYGPHAGNTMLNVTLQSIAQGKMAVFIGSPVIPREYIYLPDGAKAAVELALRPDAYGQWWNIPGAGVITGREIVRIAAEACGRPAPRIFSVGKLILRTMGLFNPMMREIVEMMYLTEQPVVLSGAKYENLIGPLPRTDYKTGIRTTVQTLLLRR